MQIYNPTKEKISVMIKGVSYECEPEDSIYNIPEEVARDWQEKTHKFIQIKKDKLEEAKKEEVVEIPKPKVEKVSAVSVQDPEIIAEALENPPEVTTIEGEGEIKSEGEIVSKITKVTKKYNNK